MTNSTLHAWVLKKQMSGDTSMRITFFTEEKGIITAIYKGARTPKKQAIIQSFLPLWLDIHERGPWAYVRKLEAEGAVITYPNKNLFAALYVNELITLALKENDSHPHLYRAYYFTIKKLSMLETNSEVEVLLRRFEWALLSACGYAMSLTHEANAHNEILVHNQYVFLPGSGFIRAEKGVAGGEILAMSRDDFSNAITRKTAKLIMRQAIEQMVNGKRIKTRELYSYS